MEINRRKRKADLREALVGGGWFLLGLPVVIFAILCATMYVGVMLLSIFMGGYNPAYLPAIIVYSVLLITMMAVTAKFVGRAWYLLQRWQGVRQEQMRVSQLTDERWTPDDFRVMGHDAQAFEADDMADAKRLR